MGEGRDNGVVHGVELANGPQADWLVLFVDRAQGTGSATPAVARARGLLDLSERIREELLQRLSLVRRVP